MRTRLSKWLSLHVAPFGGRASDVAPSLNPLEGAGGATHLARLGCPLHHVCGSLGGEGGGSDVRRECGGGAPCVAVTLGSGGAVRGTAGLFSSGGPHQCKRTNR